MMLYLGAMADWAAMTALNLEWGPEIPRPLPPNSTPEEFSKFHEDINKLSPDGATPADVAKAPAEAPTAPEQPKPTQPTATPPVAAVAPPHEAAQPDPAEVRADLEKDARLGLAQKGITGKDADAKIADYMKLVDANNAADAAKKPVAPPPAAAAPTPVVTPQPQ